MQFSAITTELTSAIFAHLETEKRKLLTAGREVFDFGTGTPDLPPASHIMETLSREAANPENYRYAIKDSPELVSTVIDWYNRRFGVTLEPDELTSMMGSQDGLAHISLILTNPGDLSMVPDPGYPIFSVGPKLAGAELYKMPLLKENGYLIDFERIDPTVAHQAKMMIVSYPNNPVTATAPPEFYEKLVWFAKKYDIMVLHDNAYCELVFDGQTGGSFLQIPGAKDVGIEFNSLSKSYNIPGCRISFALGNREIIGHLRNIKSHLDYGIYLPIQKAAMAALNGSQDCVRQTVAAYQRRRDLFLNGFQTIGWPVDKTPGTMFMWAKIPVKNMSSNDFTMELLHQTGVIVIPGSSFGEMGEGYVRIALVQPEEKILQAIELIKESRILDD